MTSTVSTSREEIPPRERVSPRATRSAPTPRKTNYRLVVGAVVVAALATAFLGGWVAGHSNGYQGGNTTGYRAGFSDGKSAALSHLDLTCYGSQQKVTPQAMTWDQASRFMYPGYAAPNVRPEYLVAAQKQSQQMSVQFLSRAGAFDAQGNIGKIPAGTILAGPTECLVSPPAP